MRWLATRLDGGLPQEWSTARLKHVARLVMGQSPPSEYYNQVGEGLPFLQGNADFGHKHPEPKVFCPTPSKKARPDDLLLSVRAPVGALNVADQKYGIGRGLCAIRPRESLLSHHFAWFLLMTVREQLAASATGSTYEAVSTDDIGELPALLPPLPEQRAIANFLDRKTAEIDALLAEKQRLLELLEEKRTALITQAVTKGLDPDVEMKDSGVEWLGEIPAHWAAVRLRHVIDDIEQGWSPSCENREATEEEWGVLKTGCVNYGQFEPAEHKALPADEEPRPELEVKPGDVLMSRASGSPELIGSVALVTATRARLLLSDKLYRLRYRRRQILPGYLAEVLGAQTIRSQIRLSISGAGGLANNLAQSDVQDYWIPLPPVAEQAAIHEFLGQTATDTQELKQVCQVAINHLHEYRTALISAAVTGKIDVRGEAA